jgi:hypothetical protein
MLRLNAKCCFDGQSVELHYFYSQHKFIISSIMKTEFAIMRRTMDHHKYTFVSMSSLPNLANLRRASVWWTPNNTCDGAYRNADFTLLGNPKRKV